MATTKSSRAGPKARSASRAEGFARLEDKLRTGGTIRVAGLGVLKIAKRTKNKKKAGVRIELVTTADGALRWFGRARVKKIKTAKRSDQERSKQMAEIVDLVSNWAGGKEQALAWYRTVQIPEFGDRTAEALVKDGLAAPLREYIDHVALGGFA